MMFESRMVHSKRKTTSNNGFEAERQSGYRSGANQFFLVESTCLFNLE
jgi:hypothetical protein